MAHRSSKRTLSRRLLHQAAIDGDSDLLQTVDGRYTHVRRLKAIVEDLICDFGSGQLQAAELCLIRRAGYLQLQAEIIEATWAAGNLGRSPPKALGFKNLRLYTTITNSLRRVLLTLSSLRSQDTQRGSPNHSGPRLLQDYLQNKHEREHS